MRQKRLKPHLIYSGGGNKRFVSIAIKAGFKYGAQLPDTVYDSLFFADQNWKSPQKAAYFRHLKKLRPHMATVLDIQSEEMVYEVIDWAYEVSKIVNKVIFVPKVPGIIKKLPKQLNQSQAILGYSVPTSYGTTTVPIEEFEGWKIHLLGGSPNAQLKYWYRFSDVAEVVSIDGNCFRRLAVQYCKFWQAPGKWISDSYKTAHDAPYVCFEKSCNNIRAYWDQVCDPNFDISFLDTLFPPLYNLSSPA